MAHSRHLSDIRPGKRSYDYDAVFIRRPATSNHGSRPWTLIFHTHPVSTLNAAQIELGPSTIVVQHVIERTQHLPSQYVVALQDAPSSLPLWRSVRTSIAVRPPHSPPQQQGSEIHPVTSSSSSPSPSPSPLASSFNQTFVRSIKQTFVRSIVRLVPSANRPSVRSFVRSSVRSFVQSFVQSFVCSSESSKVAHRLVAAGWTHSPTHSPTLSLTHSPTHSPTHSLIHSLTHSLIRG